MLTDKAIAALKPSGKIYEVADGGGLAVRVLPSGSKTFRYRYRLHGRPEVIVLGNYPDTTLAEAREAHRAARALVAKKISPAVEKRRQEEAEGGAGTVKALADDFIDRYLRRKRKRADEAARMIKREIVKPLGAWRAKDVTGRDIITLLDKITDRGSPTVAGKVRALFNQMFNHGINRQLVESNPCASIGAKAVQAGKQRNRVLSAAELKTYTATLAASTMALPNKIALDILLTTLVRKSELRLAKWAHVDFDGDEWRIPAELSKNEKPHTVYLAPQVKVLFEQLKNLAGRSEWVLPQHSNPRKPMVSATLNTGLEKVKFDIPHFTIHDLRRTGATHLAEMGFEPHVIEKTLNHTMRGVMAIYNRYDYAAERRRALGAWADRRQTIKESGAGRVVYLERKTS